MHLELQQKNLIKPISYMCNQVEQKPKFCYFQPIAIVDEDFPQQIKESNLAEYLETSVGSIETQETYYDLSNIRQVAGLKFNKASFVRMKNKNYTKYYKTVQNCIGKGAFGTVRKVQSLIYKDYRAAKCIQKNSIKEDELQKLLTEVYIMMQLDHPNIANIFEVYDFKNEFTLICELCEGGDLLKFIKSTKRRRNQERIVANIIKQLLRTVIYLHNIGIVHRDIKPQNILFQNNNSQNIKLIDFGIATKIQPFQILTSKIGTPAYMAPEIVYEKYNEKVDVWAVGITMYQLISGRIPFKGDSVREIMHSIVKDQIDFTGLAWKDISKDCIHVIKLMTNKDFLSRPSAKEIFEHPYFQRISSLDLSEDEKCQFAQNIRKFQFKNKLQAAVQTFIASQLLSIDQKNELVDFFRQFDKDNDGVISTEELRCALDQRKKISAQRIQTLMDVIDTNGSGKIDYTQFLAAGFLDAKTFTVERLKQAFAHFDTNANGKISFQEVMDFLQEFEDAEEEVEKIFKEFDKNGDGSITEDEFISLMLQRSRHMTLSKIKTATSEKNYQMRFDQNIFKKICPQLINSQGSSGIFFNKLTNTRNSKKTFAVSNTK